ncbi:MAG: lytic transglycosylase domain-containing protein [Burkholderiales bacterium]
MTALTVTRALLALVAALITLLSVAWPSSRDSVLQPIATLAVAAEPATLPAAAVPAGAFELDTDAAAPDAPGQLASPREQRALAAFIARRYRVAEEASQLFVRSAYDAGSELAVDPLLILAIMAIESSFNPVAQSSMGAMGLMQVIPRFHPEKLEDHGGEQALLDPDINIRVGTRVLHEYMRRYGNMQPALQKYAGAFDEPNAHYTNKVLAEKARLQQVQARTRREA